MSVEEKLAEYRRRKQKELNDNNLRTSVVSALNFARPGGSDKQNHLSPPPVATASKRQSQFDTDSVTTNSQSEEVWQDLVEPSPPVESGLGRRLRISTLVLKVLLWGSFMTLFVHLEFGAVYFVCSAFYLIFTNFRTGPKKAGAPSAYSVFNPNCEAIDGTLTAEQFERELKFGPLRR